MQSRTFLGLKRGVAGRGPASVGVADGQRIVSASTDGGGTAVYTTASQHGLVTTLNAITITGNSVSGFNVTTSIDSVTATTFTITLALGATSGTGGRFKVLS